MHWRHRLPLMMWLSRDLVYATLYKVGPHFDLVTTPTSPRDRSMFLIRVLFMPSGSLLPIQSSWLILYSEDVVGLLAI